MAKLSKVDAAKAAGVSRQTLYTYIKDGRLSVDPDGLIDTAELLRAGFTLHTLHEIGRQEVEPVGQRLTSTLDTLDVYQDMIIMLKQQLSEAQAREQTALEREKTAREREALLLQMLQDMQHRYDRLLDMPRPPSQESPQEPPGATPRQGQPAAQGGDPRGAMRRRIVALLQEHPEGLTPAEIRTRLGVERSLADTCLGMLRYGLVQRVGRGRYVVR
jgi:AcrR family transcriptional regulator